MARARRKAPATKAHSQTSHGDLAVLEEGLGYRFLDRQLLERALTHVSVVDRRQDSFQRLEFLGDRVLGLAVANMLYAAFPQAPEGELSRRLAQLVRRETCAATAAELGVLAFVRLGRSEAQAGPTTEATILSDVFEALVGAIFLDAGFDAAAAFVQKQLGRRLQNPDNPLRDPKSALQEWSLARALDLPVYAVVDQSGPVHAPKFTIGVDVRGFERAVGEGGSKRVAEQAAAEAFLARQSLVEQA